MGAEKTAPPGIGRRPIMAGKRARFSRVFRLMPSKEFKRRLICPLVSKEWLRTRIKVITRKSMIVSMEVSESITETPTLNGERRNHNPSIMAPIVRAAPRESFCLIKTIIRTNIRANLTRGDMLNKKSN